MFTKFLITAAIALAPALVVAQPGGHGGGGFPGGGHGGGGFPGGGHGGGGFPGHNPGGYPGHNPGGYPGHNPFPPPVYNPPIYIPPVYNDCRAYNRDGVTCQQVGYYEGQVGQPWGFQSGTFRCVNQCLQFLY